MGILGALVLFLFAVATAATVYLNENHLKRVQKYDAIVYTLSNKRRGDAVRIKGKKDILSFDALLIGKQGDNIIVSIVIEDFEQIVNIYDIEYIYKLNK